MYRRQAGGSVLPLGAVLVGAAVLMDTPQLPDESSLALFIKQSLQVPLLPALSGHFPLYN